MALPITVPYTFGNATTAIPLSNLDSDYATVYQAVNGIGNGSVALANVTISGVSTPITGAQGGTGLTSFTANGVVYASSTSALATGSSVVWTGTNFGIGTSLPTQKLTVSGGIASIAGISALSASSVFFDYNSGNGRFAAVGSTTGTPAPITISQYSSNGSVGRDVVTIDSSGNLDLSTGGAVLSLNRGAYSQQTKFYQDAANGSGAQYETTNPTVNVGYYPHVFKGTNNVPTTVEYGRFNQFGLGLGGATPSSGTGIAFPATQSASSDANTLDDYEKGTWTVGLTAGTSGTITTNTQTGTYTKVGRQVTVNGFITVASVSSPVGLLRMTGLPFACGTVRCAVSIWPHSLNALAATAVVGFIIPNESTVVLYVYNAGNGANDMASYVQAGTNIAVTATYQV